MRSLNSLRPRQRKLKSDTLKDVKRLADDSGWSYAFAMKVLLTKSQWKEKELDGQTVEFREPGNQFHELGRFMAVDCPNGLLSLSIVTDQTGRT